MRSPLRLTLASAVLVLIGVSLGAAASAWFPILILLQAFAAQVAGVAVLCVLLALALRMWPWALVSAALALWQGSLLLPFSSGASADHPPSGAPLRVLSINLWRDNPDPARTIDYLLRSGADVIGAVESTPEWQERLKALRTVYPYHADCLARSNPCWAELFSKHPILRASTSSGTGPPIIVWAEIEWEGKPITIGEVQISNPLIGLERDLQGQIGSNLNRDVSELPGDTVLMGDFNSTPWGSLQSDFRLRTGFDNRGRLAFTWPSWPVAVIRLPIDQIFIRGALTVRNYHAGPAVGSDHLPLLADIYRTSP